jgi:DNA-binding SARP family transcriptional activator
MDAERLLEQGVHTALESGDSDAAAALVVAGLLARWESGRRLDQPAPWLPLTEGLLASTSLSRLAAAALSVHRLVAGQLGGDGLDDLLADLPTLRRRVEATDSVPIRLIAAAAQINLHALAGQLHQARECLRDAAALAVSSMPEGAALLHLATKAALLVALDVDVGEPAQRLISLMNQADLGHMPLNVRLAARSHLLLCLARRGDVASADRVAEELRSWVVPAQRSYHHSLLHYALGVADLIASRPSAALWHAERAMEVGQTSGSQSAELIPALLRLQALADLGRWTEAETLFQLCLPRWTRCGMRLQATNAWQERAIWSEQAGWTEAQQASMAQALASLHGETQLPRLHRPSTADSAARGAVGVEVAAARVEQELPRHIPPTCGIEVRTLGEFRLSINGQRLNEREWRGRKTRELLKLLIAHGGQASVEVLCDALWPEADGAQARQNLKVAVWRLRRLNRDAPADAQGVSLAPWVQQLHGVVRLDPERCRVDALQLLGATTAGGPARGEEGSEPSPDRYCGDFLPGEDAPVFVAFRERLHGIFVNAALTEAKQALQTGEATALARAQQRVCRVLQLRPGWEPGFALLMELQLAAGQVNAALSTFLLADAELLAHGRRGAGPELRALRSRAQATAFKSA